jgi:hypothetical protein
MPAGSDGLRWGAASRWSGSSGRIRHGMHKMTSGASSDRVKATGLRGVHFHWFRPDVGTLERLHFVLFLARCYVDEA